MTSYRFDELTVFASDILCAAGLEKAHAETVANTLVSADAMEHSTHGLAYLPFYVSALKTGAMRPSGTPDVIKDKGPVTAWQGKRLSGIWLVNEAVKLAIRRAQDFGIAIVTIREAHHTGCLATFLPQITQQGLMGYIAVSGPAGQAVVPHGGKTALLTPNPFAVAIPTNGTPILIDMSSSITTNSMAEYLVKSGDNFPGQWAQDNKGRASHDPSVLFGPNKGGLLPLGGQEYGHKGFALALTVEALTQGLVGYGRGDQPSGSQTNVYIQITDPEAFAGREAFNRQTTHLVSLCQESEPIQEGSPVRLPGERAMSGLERAQREGLILADKIVEGLERLGDEFEIALPVKSVPTKKAPLS